MNEELLRELVVLTDRVKAANRSKVYDKQLYNDLKSMVDRIKNILGELRIKYNEAFEGSKTEKLLFEQAETIAEYGNYFVDALKFESEKKKKEWPSLEGTGAVIGKSKVPRSYNRILLGERLFGAAFGMSFVLLIGAVIFAHREPEKTGVFTNDIKVAYSKLIDGNKKGKTENRIPKYNDSSYRTETKAYAGKVSENSEKTENKIPEYTDPTDEEQVKAVAKWYYDEYFNEEFKDLPTKAKEEVSEYDFADYLPIASGEKKLYTEFNVADIMQYNSAFIKRFCSFLSLKNETGKVSFVPSQRIYIKGSYASKCTEEVDAVLKPLIEAMKRKDDEAYKKYATEFGILMYEQYYFLDGTGNHYNVRGSDKCIGSKPTMWAINYCEYTNKIMTYGIAHNIDICIPFCIDNNTGETISIPLSKLMATLQYVPIDQWDAVLKRAGITVEEIKALGNVDTENTMIEAFIRDAQSHYEKAYTRTR